MTPWSLILAGIALIVIGSAAASNYRGVGDWYLRSGDRQRGQEKSTTERRMKWERVTSKCGIALGALLLLGGLLSL
jgi:hypothetical protein